ncbi:MAG TPA: adenylate kinase [Thermoleophilia bacterium]|nr:adenylate kinase [Thermoleophilia bacterium]
MATAQLNLVLLGAPGSGKGTQAERIAPAFGLPHISTGDILRAAVKAGTELGATAKRFMDSGELVPDEVVIGIIRERLAEPDAARGFMLDGFPRTLEQARALDEMLDQAGRGLTMVLLIDVPEEELVQRLAGRRACRDCGKGYNVVFDPPKVEGVCDVCGGELFQRDDDNEDTVRNRLAVYRAQTEPLIGYYRGKGVLESVFGGGRTPDQVYGDVERLLAARQA